MSSRVSGGECRRSNLNLFVLVLVNQNFIEDENEFDDEGCSCRAVAQRAKAAHLTSVFCTLKPRVELHENSIEFHEVLYKRRL